MIPKSARKGGPGSKPGINMSSYLFPEREMKNGLAMAYPDSSVHHLGNQNNLKGAFHD